MAFNNKTGSKPGFPSMATAPYNFVSLPKKPLLHPLIEELGIDKWHEFDKERRQTEFSRFVACKGKNSGYINLTIKTLSPCFIGGEIKDETMQFFTIDEKADGTPVIPGSSLRGMTKNIYKIVTCGTMRANEDFADRHLYFRRIMSGTNNKDDDTLQSHYEELTNQANGGTKAGFLIRTKDGKYFVCPAICQKKETIPAKRPRDMGGITFHTDNNGMYAICITGEIDGKQHRHHIANPDFRKEARIPMEEDLSIVENYEADKTRRGINLLKYGKKGNEARGFTKEKDIEFVVPCFYTEKNARVQSFGHGSRYRVPYLSSIGDCIPSGLLAGDAPIDFADMVFGNKDYWATRVFFEDARPPAREQAKPDNFGYPHPLMAPNPTSYQLYLEQDGSVGKNHWDTPKATIRGYKFYWHRFAAGKKNLWIETNEKKIVRNMKKIRPIKQGAEFKGKIRFENLSDEELGALCASVGYTCDGHKIAYKIGMGKSIGMGSISIEPELFLEDMDMCYCQLFSDDNGGWMQDNEEKEIGIFIQDFSEYRSEHLSKDDVNILEKSLRELGTLLDCDQKDSPEWLEKTNMMQIGQRDKDGRKDNRLINRISLLDTLKFTQVKLK